MAKEEPVSGRERLRKELFQYRREFIKRTIIASACAAPVITSFQSKDLVRAASCPGVGNCGSSMANPGTKGKRRRRS